MKADFINAYYTHKGKHHNVCKQCVLIKSVMLDRAAHICSASTQKAEEGGSQLEVSLGQIRRPCCKNKTNIVMNATMEIIIL